MMKNADPLVPDFDSVQVEEYMRKSGGRIIERKGATFYAVSASVCHVCKCLLSGVDTTLTVSTMMNGEYGLSDVALSVLTIVGNKGAHNKVLLPLNDEELAKLHKSAESLKNVISSITI